MKSFKAWNQDHAPILAAGLAFFSVFALAPLLLIAVAIAGLIFGEAAAQGAVADTLSGMVGEESAQIIQRIMASLDRPGENLLASLLGLAGMLVGASGIFLQIQAALNIIWKARPRPRAGFLGTLLNRALAFGIVAGTGFLLLLFLALNTALAALGGYLARILPATGGFLPLLSGLLSVMIFTLAFGALFKYLPAVRLSFRDIRLGAFLTSVFFSLGAYLISWYLGTSSSASIYRAASTLFVLLLWIFYSAQIFLFGAEFTKVSVWERRASEGQLAAPLEPVGEEAYRPWMVAGALALGGFLIGRRSAARMRPLPDPCRR